MLLPPASSAGVTAEVDRSAIAADETVQLQIEIVDEPAAEPDLSVLATDFHILDRRSSRSLSVIDGQRSERHILTLRLLPRSFGELTIPAIPVGQTATPPIRLSVAPTSADMEEPGPAPTADAPASSTKPAPAAILEASVEPAQAYIGQQLILTAKVFLDGPILRPRLHDPQVPRTEVLPLGEDRYRAQRNGRDHQVYERRYALFPRDPGRLEIDPLLFEGWTSDASGNRAGMGFAAAGRPLLARSPTLSAEVLAKPDGAASNRWLPARNLTLSESGPEIYRVRVGQPIERRISLRAEGIMARNLPALAVQAPPETIERKGRPRLRDERLPQGVIGTRQETVTLTAQKPGHYRLPPLSLDWWNTAAGRWETAMLPARELVVSAGQAEVPRASPDVARTWQQPSQATVPMVTQDTPAAPSETAASPDAPSQSEGHGFWTWIAIALGAGWLITMAAWWRSKRRTGTAETVPPTAEPHPPSEAADPFQSEINAIQVAYERGDAGAAREALLAWAGRVLPEQTPSNLARLAQRCPEPLRGQILLLEEAFFSPSPVPWDKQPVWKHLPGFIPAPREEPASFRRGKPIRRRAANPDAE